VLAFFCRLDGDRAFNQILSVFILTARFVFFFSFPSSPSSRRSPKFSFFFASARRSAARVLGVFEASEQRLRLLVLGALSRGTRYVPPELPQGFANAQRYDLKDRYLLLLVLFRGVSPMRALVEYPRLTRTLRRSTPRRLALFVLPARLLFGAAAFRPTVAHVLRSAWEAFARFKKT